MLRLHLLGKPELYIDGKLIETLKSAKAYTILAYLILMGRPIPRESLSARLWAAKLDQLDDWETSPADRKSDPGANFRTEWKNLNQVSGLKPYLLLDDQTAGFNTDLPYEVDVQLLTGLLKKGTLDDLLVAVQLYRGNFLETLRLNNISFEIESWITTKQDSLLAKISAALRSLGVYYARQRQYDRGRELVNRWLELDPHAEDAYRLLMLITALEGRRHAAYDHYTKYATALEQSGEPPDPAFTQLAAEIREHGATPALLDQFQCEYLNTQNAPFLVPPLTRYPCLGRGTLIAELVAKIAAAPSGSTFCLSGMGGIGKTTLAIHLGHELRGHFLDGVLWADLLNRSTSEVLQEWGQAFGQNLSSVQSDKVLANLLRTQTAGKRLLLILDDLQSEAQLDALLSAVIDHVLIITARPRSYESLQPDVTSVPLLPPESGLDILRRTLPPPRIEPELSAAADLCRLLEHLPLAIKIAGHLVLADSTTSLSDFVREFSAEVNKSQALEFGTMSVQTVFDRSWKLLNEGERDLFAALGLFAARSFSLEAAASLIHSSPFATRQVINKLVWLSLINREDRRFRLHALLSDYARARLAESGQRVAILEPIVGYFIKLISELSAESAIHPDDWASLRALIEETYALEQWERCVALVEAATESWFLMGRYTDARRGLTLAGQAAGQMQRPDLRARFIQQLGQACIEQSDYDEARGHLLISRDLYQDLFREQEEPVYANGVATCLLYLGRSAVEMENYDEAEEAFVQAFEVKQSLNDHDGMGEILYYWCERYLITRAPADIERAGQIAEQVIENYELVTNEQRKRVGIMRGYILRSHFAIQQRLFEQALVECEQALQWNIQANAYAERSIIFYLRAQIRGFMRDMAPENLSLGLSDLKQSIDLLTQAGDRKMLANALQVQMVFADFSSDIELAFQAGKHALELFEALELPARAEIVRNYLSKFEQPSS
ncbi:MAG: hypothetical protein KF726_23210 [Anaerolineae bacterium]|nr:hypothetical protein [Anaerolineae bacterium]